MKIARRRRFPILLLLVAFVSLPLTAAEKPSLVVVLSVDQMRSDYLQRFRPYFGKDGFNRFLEHGAAFPQARYRHAITFTGPGHASIGTGLDPRDHGIVGNLWWDLPHGHEVYCVEDRRVQWVGQPAGSQPIPIAPASPVNLDDASLGDRLKERFPKARVVGVALKDRAAVLMAGRKADAALWFEERFARFVTSTYYPSHPELLFVNDRLAEFFASHREWTLSGRIPATALAKITFDPPELYSAKNPPAGFGATFPHPLENPKAIVSSPFGDELVLEVARFVVEKMRLGSEPEHPDLLFIGLSSTDYYGHWFGPDSKEIADGIVRLDGTLEKFLAWLDDRVGRGRALVFLTADHGVTPIPAVARAKRKVATGVEDPSIAGRVNLSNGRGESAKISEEAPDRVALESALAKTFGYELDIERPNVLEGAVIFFEEPSLYLNRPVLARRRLSVERVKEAVRDWIRKRPGVLEAFTNTEIANGLPATSPYALAIERSFRADRSGDVFVVLKPGWMWSYGREVGTTHGQPNDDDTRVPLLVFGPGVRAGSWDAKLSPLSIARTVGALFGFEAGEPDAEILAPVLGRDIGAKKLEKAAAAR